MEASGLPRREADVSPAAEEDPTSGRVGISWSPADPGPLGLAAFALTTFVLSLINTGMVGGGSADRGWPIVAPLALAYGGIAQFVAGLWEFRTGNTFGATRVLLLRCVLDLVLPAAPRHRRRTVRRPRSSAHLGLYLWAWGIFTAYMFIASLRTTGAVALVFLLLAITFIVLGHRQFGARRHAADVPTARSSSADTIGIATAIAAWYASFAGVINATFARTVLPVFPLAR